jgi:osmotically-inducible protein OsmY
MARTARPLDDSPRQLTRPSDRDVKATVVGRLRDNPYTQGSRIKVQVRAGVVTLVGEVDSAVARDVAHDDTRLVPGVVEVTGALVVREAARAA